MLRTSIIIMFYLLFVSNTSIASEQFILSTGEKHAVTPIASAILDAAYHKLGIQPTIKRYPVRRSFVSANNGLTDGELFRGEIDSKQYPNLIKIPVPLATGRLMIFTKNADLQVDGWASLSTYRVGSHTGLDEVKKHKNEFKSFQNIPSIEQLFNMLARDRLDVLILPSRLGASDLKKLNQIDIKMLPIPIEVNHLYHYLHIKHQKLAPQITQVLQDMHDSGELDSIRRKVEANLLGG